MPLLVAFVDDGKYFHTKGIVARKLTLRISERVVEEVHRTAAVVEKQEKTLTKQMSRICIP